MSRNQRSAENHLFGTSGKDENMKRKTTFTLPAELEDKAQYLAKDSNDNTVRIALFYPGQLQPELMRLAVRQLVERIDILHAGFTAGMFRDRKSVV